MMKSAAWLAIALTAVSVSVLGQTNTPAGPAFSAPATNAPAAKEATGFDKLQKSINSGFDVVTTPFEVALTYPVVGVTTHLVYSNANSNAFIRARQALRTAEMVHWPVENHDDQVYTLSVRTKDIAAASNVLAAAGAGGAQPGEVTKREGFWLIVVILVVGGLFFTLWYGLVNLRLFGHAWKCVRGKYDNPEDEGEISHFKALTSALSATVGLGNIAGVAVAITMGGAGAVFWMWVVAFFGMTLKFNSCFLAQLYRRVQPDGKVLGGPMVYLDEGIGGNYPSLKWLGKGMGILFALLCVMAAFGGGNMFQVNQLGSMVERTVFGSSDAAPAWVSFAVGLVVAVLVGVVIIGGIRRIGTVTSRMVPVMCGGYCVIALIILAINYKTVPGMFASIFHSAFTSEAVISGGLIGVLFQAMKRAAFSNEAGLGSAAIAHAAAKTKEPVREGVVAMLGPFIDTIVVCTMTALMILVTGAHKAGAGEGVEITAQAFASLLDARFGNMLLTIMVCVFAYSTLISWCYYGERCVEYLFGKRGILPYRIVYVMVVMVGPVLSLGRVIDFSDMMLLSMAFPNIIGSMIIAPKVKHIVKDYVRRLRAGDMKSYM